MNRTMIHELPTKIGQKVCIKGWVDVIREHGKLVFIDLRDFSGIVQSVISSNNKNFEKIKNVSKECCLSLFGEVKARPTELELKNLSVRDIEISIDDIEILNSCPPLPFDLKNDNTNEDIRLKYRYLDLRRFDLQKKLILRGQIIQKIREYLYSKGFTEFETPILAKSTPEGARDYIVPSRTQEGTFFALPQSPQLFKQLLMVGGLEKYFQIARCFRDEDLRSDRQPEFTQLDCEMSFVDEEDIYAVVEGVLKHVLKEVFNVDIQIPFRRISYSDSISRYNSDKPDLRPETGEKYAFSWITNFPLFEYSEEEKRYVAAHHPFCMPKNLEDLEKDPLKVLGKTYDLVLNGVELLSGSVRIHIPEIQRKVFDLLNISREEQDEKFGFFLESFKYGAPPHGGFAIGLDRLIQLFVGASSIREVIAFPKNKEAKDLMLEAPSRVDDKQLRDVHIKLDMKKE